MSKISIVRYQRNGTRTFRRWEMEEVADELRSNRFSKVIYEYRSLFRLLQREDAEERMKLRDEMLEEVPRICFSTDFKRSGEDECIMGYSPLLMMKVSNLRSEEVTKEVCLRASQMPYTRLCFTGVSGLDAVIVCELTSMNRELENEDDFADLLRHGYALLRKIYSDHLHCVIDLEEPKTDAMCYLSIDQETYYNPISTPFRVNMLTDAPKSFIDDTFVLPAQVGDREERHRWRRIYIDNLRKAQCECFTSEDPEYETLLLLARYCHETGMPQALAESFALLNGEFSKDEALLRDTFATEYEKELRNAYADKHLNKTAQLMMRTAHFLNVHFRMRRNKLNGVVEYRLNDGTDFNYHILTKEMQNSMTIMALAAGLNSWDKDLNRFINSTMITEYDPVNAFLDSLPKWDGRDRIGEVARRVPTQTTDWERNFHIWMRSMVAQWMGRDEQHGNAIAPILIGAQATGKSSFCRILLPECLQEYYNDSIHFKDDKSVFLALSSFALINIDEFDSLSRSQQPLLKYLLSKTDVKYRAVYRSHIEQHKRYASFIGTTNNLHPLNDPTGSRRFICVKVDGVIDFSTPIDHLQLYAQLREEVMNGERYWFTKEEADAITMQNSQFQKKEDISNFITSLFHQPIGNEASILLTPAAIVEELQNAYPTLTLANDANTQVGKAMKKLGFEMIRGQRREYKVVKKSQLSFPHN